MLFLKQTKTNYSGYLFVGAAILFMLTVGACNKPGNVPPKGFVEAVFTGPDLTMTMCSGGYFFTVDNEKFRAYDIEIV